MRRVATLMVLKEGMESEYRRRHAQVWPEVVAGIERAGIRNYSIFMRGLELFSYFEVEDLERSMSILAGDPVNQQWQEYMAPLFELPPGIRDGSTVYLDEVFHTG